MSKPVYNVHINTQCVYKDKMGLKLILCSACAFRFNCEDIPKTNMQVLKKWGITGNQWMVSDEYKGTKNG